MKKMFLCFLSVAILLSGVAGCSTTTVTSEYILEEDGTEDSAAVDSLDENNDASDNDTDEGSADTPVAVKDPYSVDLGGTTITIAIAENYSFLIDADPNESSYYKAISQRTKKLEKELNCKISLKKSTDAQALTTKVTNALLAGEQYCDVIMTAISQASTFAAKGLLADLNSIKGIDLTKDYMNAGNFVTNTKVGNKVFAVAPKDSLLNGAVGVYFNKNIISELKLENPYNLLSSKKWTISKMREMALAAKSQNITDTSGRYGMSVAGFSWESTESILANNRTTLITNNNGEVTYTADSAGVAASIAQAKQMYVTDKSAYINHTDDETAKMFIDGRALFLVGYLAYADDIASMDDDFGFVPFPRGDNQNDYLTAVNYNARAFLIPANLSTARKRAAGAFIQAFMYASENTVEAYIDEMDVRYFRDDESGANAKICADNLTINPHAFFTDQGGNLDNGTLRVIFQGVDGRQEVSKVLADYSNGSKAVLNDLLEKMKSAK